MGKENNKGKRRKNLHRLLNEIGDKIRVLLEKYEYRAISVLRDTFAMNYNPLDRVLELENFYKYSDDATVGSCAELMHGSYKELRREYPNLSVYRVVGTEPSFFPRWPHCYLIICKNDVLEGAKIADCGHLTKIYEGESVLVDPSFHKVKGFRKSGYGIGYLINHDFPFICPTNQIVQEKMEVPLFHTNNLIMVLSHSSNCPTILQIGFQYYGSTTEYYSLDSTDLDKRVNGNQIQAELINSIRRKRFTIVDHPLCLKGFTPLY